jgi:hypothetical protein
MPCSTRFVCLRIAALAAALLLAAAGAQASAWLEPAGQGQIILGGTFSDSLRNYDVRGRLAPLSSYKKFELTAYTEYGLTDSVTLIAARRHLISEPSRRVRATPASACWKPAGG